MVTVKDVLNLGIFEDIWLAAPCEGCEERLVTGAGILDFEPFWGDYDSFTPGEFIFTSLGFAQRDPDLADQAVRAMIERDVAALVIKPVAMDAISAEAAELSTARGVPVFFYEGHFVERLMAAVLALVAEDRAQSQRDALIDALIAPRGDADVREGLFEVARTTGATVQCLAARPLAPDGCMLSALQGELGALLYDFQRNQASVVQACVVRYRDQLLAFVSYDRPPRGAIARSEADLVARIEAAGRLRCGVSQEVSLGQGDLAIRQARTALDELGPGGLSRRGVGRPPLRRNGAALPIAPRRVRPSPRHRACRHRPRLCRVLRRGARHGRGALPASQHGALPSAAHPGGAGPARRIRQGAGRPPRFGVFNDRITHYFLCNGTNGGACGSSPPLRARSRTDGNLFVVDQP